MKRDALFIKLTYLNILLFVVQYLSMIFVTLNFIPFDYTSYFNLLLTIHIIIITCIALHAKRKTLLAKDMQLAKRLTRGL